MTLIRDAMVVEEHRVRVAHADVVHEERDVAHVLVSERAQLIVVLVRGLGEVDGDVLDASLGVWQSLELLLRILEFGLCARDEQDVESALTQRDRVLESDSVGCSGDNGPRSVLSSDAGQRRRREERAPDAGE